MKKRLIILLLACITALAGLTLVACGDKDVCAHAYGEWVIDTPATCTTGGVKSRTCSVCSNKETEVIPAGHTYNGNGVCTVCGYSPYTQGLAFELNDDGVSYAVTGLGTATESEIFIPEIYQGVPVTVIGEWAFKYCDSLTSITIPQGVTSIEGWAFQRCDSLTSITIPVSVTNIGFYAFLRCSSLTSITYGGTKAEWSAISKKSHWNDNTGDYTVTCKDGVLSKSES